LGTATDGICRHSGQLFSMHARIEGRVDVV